jgi:tetratricopeptide (TPR) repeat protein
MPKDTTSGVPGKESSKQKGESSTNRVNSLFNLLNKQIVNLNEGDSMDQRAASPDKLDENESNVQNLSDDLSKQVELKNVVEEFEELDRKNDTNEPYHRDSLYLSMMAHFQRGEWEPGLDELVHLMDKFPAEKELIYLKKEMEIHSRFDISEGEYSKQTRRKHMTRLTIQLLILVAAFLVIFGVVFSYYNWFQTRFNQIRQQVITEQQTYILRTKFNNAQQLLSAFRPDEAQTILKDIQSTNPDYPGLAQALNQSQSQKELQKLYQDAMQMKQSGDLVGALAKFQEIETTNPNYRDVTLQTRDILRQFTMDDLIEEADRAFQSGDWVKAIGDYEQVRNRDFSYQTQIVEQRLYYSYLNAAQKLLIDQPDSIEALNTAQEYYSNALSLKPQDVTVLEELQSARDTIGNRLFNKYIELAQNSLVGQADSIEGMKTAENYFALASSIRPSDAIVARERNHARLFLSAQTDFLKRNWESVITNLSIIYESSPDYAGGTARQTLYDAYIMRGDYFLTSGSAKSALEDYQKALAIAEISPEFQIRLFEAQTKIGDILGLMNSYEAAIIQYRAAMDSANINQILLTNLDFVKSINQADEYIRRKMYKAAFNIYHEVMRNIATKFQTITHVVQSGDYLTQLANLYKTTASEILKANNLSDPSDLSIGERILIPVIP